MNQKNCNCNNKLRIHENFSIGRIQNALQKVKNDINKGLNNNSSNNNANPNKSKGQGKGK